MSQSASENRLLSSLLSADLARLTARMTNGTFGHKDTLQRAGGPLDWVHFPLSGILSAVVVMDDGQTAEAVAIGREGMIGATACLGATRGIFWSSAKSPHPNACAGP